MKQTNERAVIRLLHAPTGQYIDFHIAETAVPSVHYMNQRAFKEREKLDAYLEKHEIDLDKMYSADVKRKEGAQAGTLAPEHLRKIGEMNSKIIKLKMDAVSSILEPAAGLPEDFDSKRELIEQCISGAEVIPAIMDFFSKHSGSTTTLPAHSPRPIQILDRNGEEWESAITKALQEKDSSSA